MFTHQYENGKYQIFHHGILVSYLGIVGGAVCLIRFYVSFVRLFGLLELSVRVCNIYYECSLRFSSSCFLFQSFIPFTPPNGWLYHFEYDWKEYIIFGVCVVFMTLFCCCLVLVVYVLQLLLLSLFKPTVAQADHHLTYHCCKWANSTFRELRLKWQFFWLNIRLHQCCSNVHYTNSKQLPNSVSASFFFRLVWIFVVVRTFNT